ncbi:MAG: hypothetical protein HYY24_28215 [Verrucomicrobia bacterium]|nr:hypothetical protein [Verrucomicrobiota bacterium]
MLNYRYQICYEETNLRALAPRFSLVLPTGDERRGLGEDTLGYQWNVPFSTAMGDSWFLHLNAGLTYLPEAASARERDLLHYHLGASTILAATRNVHFLVEWIGVWQEGPHPTRRLRHEFAALVSPGVRTAWSVGDSAQLVLGLGVPIGLTRSAPDVGVFLYLSFEHESRKNRS